MTASTDNLGLMLRASIRLIEKQEISVEGDSLESIHDQLTKACPDGFTLVEAPVKMGKTGGQITALGTYMRRDTTRDIEAATRAELAAQVPEGWQMLYVLNDA